jgi:putative exosortase-associated protein (TIGR04073 family)
MRPSAKCVAVLAAALALAFPPAAHAANPATKLTRGIVNLTTGWLEIPNQMAQREDDGTTMMWTVHGFLNGLSTGVARTFYGAYDILTFPFPSYDAPMMDPDTIIAPKPSPDR